MASELIEKINMNKNMDCFPNRFFLKILKDLNLPPPMHKMEEGSEGSKDKTPEKEVTPVLS